MCGRTAGGHDLFAEFIVSHHCARKSAKRMHEDPELIFTFSLRNSPARRSSSKASKLASPLRDLRVINPGAPFHFYR
jgi:hypothetical protein